MRQDSWIAKHRLVSFFVLAFLVSWPLFLVAGATKVSWAAAVIVATITQGRVGIGQLLGRFLIWRISPLWFAFALLFPAASYAISSYVSQANSGAPTYSPSSQWYLIPLIFVGLFLVVIGEEVGWRGYALPLLQRRWNATVASLVLAVPWTIWHFAIITNPVAPNLGSIAGLAFIPFVFAIAVSFTVVFNNTKGSLLAVLAFHASGDTAGFFLHLTSRAYEINVAINVVVAILFVLLLGPKQLSRTSERIVA
jgi:membrane protease YdiL (CAAX protease family)